MNIFDILRKFFYGGRIKLNNIIPIFYFDDEEEPEPPQFQLPSAIKGLDQEIINLIRSRVGLEAGEPGELGISSQVLQGLLGFQPQQVQVPEQFGQAGDILTQLSGIQPDQFQFPLQDIQAALQAQQDIQKQQFLQQIRPIAARQGQLDSSAFQNQIGDFIQNQQAQSLGTTADLLTQQAQQNFQLQQFLPQFRSGIAGQIMGLGGALGNIDTQNVGIANALPQFQAMLAGQLAGIGGQRSGIEQFNLQLPFQTAIPAFQGSQQIGLGEAGQRFDADLVGFNQQQKAFDAQQAQNAQLFQGLGGLAIGALTGGIGGAMGLIPGITSGLGGFGAGSLKGLGQIAGFGSPFGLFEPPISTSTIFNPNSKVDLNTFRGF